MYLLIVEVHIFTVNLLNTKILKLTLTHFDKYLHKTMIKYFWFQLTNWREKYYLSYVGVGTCGHVSSVFMKEEVRVMWLSMSRLNMLTILPMNVGIVGNCVQLEIP